MNLQQQELHVWLAALDLPLHQQENLIHYLHADEKARAARFKFEKDRQHFIAARGILRDILSRYTSTSPASLQFSYGEHGKPQLQNNSQYLQFNVSHSYGYAFYGVLFNHEVGVDIEFMREDLAGDDIAKRFFSDNEYQALIKLPKKQRLTAFFNCWTRKEAFIKALGSGFTFPLKDFDVSLDEKPVVLRIKDNPQATVEWKLYAFNLLDNYAASVATKADVETIKQFNWNNVNI